MPKIPASLKASLLAVAIVGGGYQAMTPVVVEYVEGVEYYPYRDVGGVLTVCAGHTGADIVMRRYTPTECRVLLSRDLKPVYAAIERLVTVPLTDFQRTALATFVYNTGVGAFASSTLLKKLNAGDMNGARDQMRRWVFAAGKRWKGLMTRREVEMAIFDVRGPHDLRY